ncbi:S8 family peptidase [Bradyrhizobium diazoefficiens]|uniref:S8 family peptidase n=1 Tax=Bradyrhizobium diazoefficiens TaxID=1355477 RepID=UPI00272B23A7|nr:S8 family peptidase [Bradyrhizobium diazoefficiens]WLA74093.1 S8 family peptidase [Bradyrhizobium diazoefficiens]
MATRPDPKKRGREITYAGGILPRELNDEQDRIRLGLPKNPDSKSSYVVELNLQNHGGLAEADNAFNALYRRVVIDDHADARMPVAVSKSYYSCFISLNEARRLAIEDEKSGSVKQRSIYRIWPDYKIQPHVDRSVATVKGDAALKSYNASGDGVVWAVIDSGIQFDHPHFGDFAAAKRAIDAERSDPDKGAEEDKAAHLSHTLLAPEVATLHRFFGRTIKRIGNLAIPTPLPDPDASAAMKPEERAELVRQHVELALTDEFGHGTHVAGILAGGIMNEKARTHIFQRRFKSDDEGAKSEIEFVERRVRDVRALHGVAPFAKLVSLRVLDDKGEGYASDVIRAMAYVRERLNADPKLLVVHGANLSVGYEFAAELFACGQSPLCIEVDRLVQSGVVAVAAAGNTGYGTVAATARAAKVGLSNTINDPGNARHAVTVGATHRESPHTYGVSFFSSKGPTGDGRLKPDLVAPGERITSCAAGATLKKLLDGKPDPDAAYYVDDSGTSMAAPHVSGAIAAFLSVRREFIGQPLKVKEIFLNTATSLGRERYFEGHGLVDLMRAIQSV